MSVSANFKKVLIAAKNGLSSKTSIRYFFLPVLAIAVGTVLVNKLTPPPVVDPTPDCPTFGAPGLMDRFRYWRAHITAGHVARQFSRDELYVGEDPQEAGDVLIGASERLSELADSIRNHKPFVAGRNRLIFLYGAAGSGKSAVVDSLHEISNGAFFDVGDFFSYNPGRGSHPDTEMVDQLVYGNTVISMMPQLLDSVLGADTHLVDFFERYGGDASGGNKASVSPAEAVTTIIDGLDEIHPDSAIRLINAAWRFVEQSSSTGEIKNVVLSGRGEAFRQFFQSEENSHLKFEAVYVGPLYVYREPLLSWHAADWRWWTNGREGSAPGEEEVQADVDGARAIIGAHSEVRHFMFTLVPANFVYDHLRYHDQDNLVSLLFDALVSRNARRHYRPTNANAGREWHLYRAALRQVARMALRRVDADGTFVLEGSAHVCIVDGQKPVHVNAAATLNHSGLIDLNPFERTHLEYRWFPLPLLEYLAQ